MKGKSMKIYIENMDFCISTFGERNRISVLIFLRFHDIMKRMKGRDENVFKSLRRDHKRV